MYRVFYNLKQKPFQISTDPTFLWLGEKHEEALATLRYGILDNKGFLLLTGDVGTGKTTLINALLQSLKKNTLVATIRDPALKPMDFYHYTAYAFGLNSDIRSKASFLIKLEKFLHQANRSQQKVLLIIDEAQRITQALLEEVRLLSNIEKQEHKLLNIFFVGQIEFNDILLKPENRPIRQRITVNYNISPLTPRETKNYIYHRLKVAGTTAKLFDNDALREIFSFSKGYPRLINIICDRALLTGFVEESSTIRRYHIQECVNELSIHRSRRRQQFTQKDREKAPPRDISNRTIPENSAEKPTPIPTPKKRKDSKNIRNTIILTGILIAAFIFYAYTDDSNLALKKRTGQYTQRILLQIKGLTAPKKRPIDNEPTPTVQGDKKETNRENAASQNNIEKKQAKKNPQNILDTKPTYQSDTEEAMGKDFQRQKNTKKITATDFPTAFDKLIIPFPFSSNLPPATSLEKLNRLAEALLTQSKYTVIVTGYTDSQGNTAFNSKLSEFRANAVKSYLVGRGLKEPWITTKGMGPQHPIEANNTDLGRSANRRVEIHVEQ